MKKSLWHDTNFVFFLLQICAFIAALLGGLAIFLVLCYTLHSGHTPWFILECILWMAAWADFFLMCRRLRREPSAFTQKNARTLLVISCCCGAIGLMQLLPWLRNLGLGTPMLLLMELLPPLCFLGVAAVGMTLRGLLKRAMALQEESELTI